MPNPVDSPVGAPDPRDEAAIGQAKEAAIAAIVQARDLASLKEARLAATGDHAPLTLANRAIGGLEPADKAAAGKLIGQARGEIGRALAAREKELKAERDAAVLRDEAVDVTLASGRLSAGARHPLELVRERMEDVFTSMGWEIAEGPEVEAEWYNFDALNFDPDHPARQMQDTFFVDPPSSHLVLRTHTSPVQIRALLQRGAPLYVACPGRVFRTDELDATHTPVFTQIEGLAVDKGLTMAHLKGTLAHLAQAMFGTKAKVRFRPSYFPFTEPSAEPDVWFENKKGGPGWIEWGGCGMVHPNVLKAGGIDPDVYTGFAFGMGVERTLMFRHDVTDMRDMIEGDVRFSRRYGMAER